MEYLIEMRIADSGRSTTPTDGSCLKAASLPGDAARASGGA